MISGIFIILMMIAFFGIVIWAYSDKQKDNFEHMSSLPLNDELETKQTKGEDRGND